jgi:sugar O-acyltransferase (sialic acid O-acetyltransferase NeuD family)
MSKEIIIIGAGGQARSITESVLSNGFYIKYYVDKYKVGENLFGYQIKKKLLINNNHKVNILIAIADNYKREKIYNNIIEKYKNIIFPNIIDATAKISKFSKIGKGNMIMVNSLIGANTKVSNFCIINNNVSIDHDCKINKFSSLAPSVIMGGNVKVGLRSAVGIGTVIKNNINIENDSLIGASSYVNKDIKKLTISYGIPAKFIRNINLNK